MRQLQTININGINFFIDVRLEQFRQCDNPYNFFSFDVIEDDYEGIPPDDEHMYFALYWNTKTNTPWNFKENPLYRNEKPYPSIFKIIPLPGWVFTAESIEI